MSPFAKRSCVSIVDHTSALTAPKVLTCGRRDSHVDFNIFSTYFLIMLMLFVSVFATQPFTVDAVSVIDRSTSFAREEGLERSEGLEGVDTIVFKKGSSARLHVRREILPKLSRYDRKYVRAWLNESSPVSCYIMGSSGFALLHRVDHDPYNQHANPKILDFAFVFDKDKSKILGGDKDNLLIKMLVHVRQENDVTALAGRGVSMQTFEKAGYKIINQFLARAPATSTTRFTPQQFETVS